MARIMARVSDRDDAERGVAGGVDALLVMRPRGVSAFAATVRAIAQGVGGRVPLWAVLGEDAAEAAILRAGGVAGLFVSAAAGAPSLAGAAHVVVFADRVPTDRDLDAARSGGAVGALLSRQARTVDAVATGDLAHFAESCRSRGLEPGISGGLEPPDIPRLLAFGYDLLVFRRALCAGGDRRAPLDTGAIRTLQALVADRAGAPSPGSAPIARPDRIFVRDLVLQMAIGAYASEIGRAQRVRFSVEATIRPIDTPALGLGDIVSYDLISDAIRHLAQAGHVALVETLAERIADRVLAHPRIVGVHVVVEKLDLGPGSVGVEIWRERPSTPPPRP